MSTTRGTRWFDQRDSREAARPAERYVGETVAERYRIEREIGRGAMGMVYLAEHVVLEKRVAIKVLLPEFAQQPALVARFLREAKAASRIGHENIVEVVDFGAMADGAPFFVMEYVDGCDLADLLEREGALSWQRVCRIGVQICSALEAAHGKNIIHRDMKPANVFLVQQPHRRDLVKILDFGIAKIIGDEGALRRLTQPGTVLGTPVYMAPEQSWESGIDLRIDVYAVGCILYELLTGTAVFDGASPIEVFARHMSEEVQPIRERAPGIEVPAALEAVVMRALGKLPEERFASMREMATAITAAAGEGFMMQEPSGVNARPPLVEDHIEIARRAIEDGDALAAFEAAELAIIEADDAEAGPLVEARELLQRIYNLALGDRSRPVRLAMLQPGVDPRATFLISRLDGEMSIDDLLDVSAMPRLEATRLVAGMLLRGVLVADADGLL